jgi:peptidoglycan/LPS O-acetylase OafA/YrhL
VANPREVLDEAEYKNYRNMRAVALWFIILGSILTLGGIAGASDSGSSGNDLPPWASLLIALLGVVGVVGGVAVRRGNRQWAWTAKVTAWLYIWAFPIGTILSFVLLDGLKKYFKSMDRLRRADSGEYEEDDAW